MTGKADGPNTDRNPSRGTPGWHRDPDEPSRLRWWDGSEWTDETYPKDGPPTPPTHSLGSTDRITLDLWTADAVVLFDWLQDLDFEALPISHKSQKQALTDLLTLLEVSVLPSDEVEVRAAQAEVARDMGW